MTDGTTLVKSPDRTPESIARVDLVGRSLLHFRVLARLGAGGMGVVYKAFDDKLRRAVALKVLGPRYVVDDRNRDLIFREARSAAALGHPNIAAIYELHDAPDGAFYVMELVEGDTLRGRGKLPIDQALRWASQIARALARAHAAGIVHRDLKADNVMIAAAGDVKLLDFGLAKMVELVEPIEHGVADQPAAHAATAVARGTIGGRGRVLGTPAYMAPEQARGEDVDARADVFAFGVLLYEMVTGVLPFAARDGVPSGDATSGDWTIQARIRELAPRAPRAIDVLVQRCLAFDRDARYADGAALVTAIDAAMRRPSRTKYVVAAALPVLAIGGYLAVRPGAAPSSDACDAASTLPSHWSTQIRTAVEVSRRGRYAAEDVAAYDAFIDHWRGAHHAACELDARQDTHALGARQIACLDRALIGLDHATLARPQTFAGATMRPPLPSLDRCTGPSPEREPAERVVVEISMDTDNYALSPDGTRYARLTVERLVIGTLDGSAETTIAIPPRMGIVGWTGAGLIIGDPLHQFHVNLATRSLEIGAAVPDNTVTMSPDGTRALVIAGESLRLVPVGGGPSSSALGPATWLDDLQAISWSTTKVLIASTTLVRVIDLTTLRVTEFPLRLEYIASGIVRPMLVDDDHVLVSGRSDLEHGESIWSLKLGDGHVDGAAELVFEAPRGTAYQVAAIGNHRVLEIRMVLHTELVSIRDGNARSIAKAPEVAYILAGDATGDRIAASRDDGTGIVSLHEGSYTHVSTERATVAYAGDRLLIVEDGHLDELDPHGARRELLRSPEMRGGTPECARDVPRCWIWLRRQHTAAELVGGALGPRFAIAPETLDVAVSPDGKRLALVGDPGWVDVMDLATQRVERWPAPTPDCTKNQFVRWLPKANAVVISALCDTSSHIYRVELGKPVVEVFASAAWLAGMVVTPSGELIGNLRHYGQSLVVIDGL